MPRFMRGIHVLAIKKKDVDGPDKPGHDAFQLTRYRAVMPPSMTSSDPVM
jgi:hypothetical protein